jgi:hypothetical protein
MSNFIHDCIIGDAGLEDIDNYVDIWHDGDSASPLHHYLGMTETEYQVWVARPEALAFIVLAHRDDTPIASIIRRYDEQPLPMAARSESRAQAVALKEWLVQHGLWNQ